MDLVTERALQRDPEKELSGGAWDMVSKGSRDLVT